MIRLARVGARKQPHYRVVVIEKDQARNGRSVEVVGTYNPRTEPATVNLKTDRIAYWISKGAQYSETVARIASKYDPNAVAAAPAVAPAAEKAPAAVEATAPVAAAEDAPAVGTATKVEDEATEPATTV